MTRKYWLDLTPSLLVGAAIVLSTFIAALAAKSGWFILAAPLLMAIAIVSADMLASRLRGRSDGPSPAALILGVTFLLAGLLVTLRDPNLVKTLIPIAGMTAWIALPMGSENRCKTRSAI